MTKSNAIYLFLTIVLSAHLLFACSPNNAANFNDNIVLHKEMADSDFITMNKYINIALAEKEYDIIDFITTTCIDSLNFRIATINRLASPPSGEFFKQSVVSYIQSLVYTSEAYKSYVILSDSLVSKDQIDSIKVIIRRAEEKTDSTSNIVLSSQKDFAKIKRLRLK